MSATHTRILSELFSAFPHSVPGEKLYPSNPNARRVRVSLTRKAIKPLGWNIARTKDGWVLEMPYSVYLANKSEAPSCVQ